MSKVSDSGQSSIVQITQQLNIDVAINSFSSDQSLSFHLTNIFSNPQFQLTQSVCSTVRCNMTEFWKEHSKAATVEEMMLDSQAKKLTEHELPEILSMLPPLEGRRVLELGAGIG